jgi:hypothetical protein
MEAPRIDTGEIVHPETGVRPPGDRIKLLIWSSAEPVDPRIALRWHIPAQSADAWRCSAATHEFLTRPRRECATRSSLAFLR